MIERPASACVNRAARPVERRLGLRRESMVQQRGHRKASSHVQ
jgi:hypothetical protein